MNHKKNRRELSAALACAKRRNPFRVDELFTPLTQGRRSYLAPTLGWFTERRWRSWSSLPICANLRYLRASKSDDLLDHLAFHEGEPFVAAEMGISQASLLKAELMEHGGV